jgi:hypothetical protein
MPAELQVMALGERAKSGSHGTVIVHDLPPSFMI